MKLVRVFYVGEFGDESFKLVVDDTTNVNDYCYFQDKCYDDFYEKYEGIADKYSDVEFLRAEEVEE